MELVGTLNATLGTPVRAVTFSSNGRVLAAASSDRTIRIWDMLPALQGAQLRATKQNPVASNALAFAPDGARLAAGLENGGIDLLGVGEQVELTTTIGPHGHAIHSLEYSADGSLLACGTDQGIVMLEAATGEVRWADSIGFPVPDVRFSPDGKALAVAGRKAVHVYDAATGQQSDFPPLAPNGVPVHSVSFQHNHLHLLTGGSDSGKVLVYDLPSKAVRPEIPGPLPVVWVSFSPDGRVLATVDKLGRVDLRGAENSLAVQPVETFGLRSGLTFGPPLTPPVALRFAPTSQGLLAFGTFEGRVHLLDVLATG